MANTRLSFVEGQRVSAVLDECIEKLQFLGTITPDVLQHRDELSKFVGEEISRILIEQRRLEQRYEELIAQRSALKGLANKSNYKVVQGEIQEVSKALVESTRNLCRNLKDNPNISGNLMKIQRERNDLIELLNRTVGELKESGTCSILMSKVADGLSSQDKLQRLIADEKNTSEAVRKLDKELINEKEEHESRAAELQSKIAKLKEELTNAKAKTTVDVKYARREANARAGATVRMHRQSERKLQSEIRELERRVEVENVVHKETVDFLRRKQGQLERDAEAWEIKFEEEYNALDAEFIKLTNERKEMLERLHYLQQRREDEIETEQRKQKELEEKLDHERRQREEQLRENRAASKIQKCIKEWYKVVSVQKQSKSKKTTKKGGKKK